MSRYYISTIGSYPNNEPFAVINDNKLREVVATGTLADCMIQLYALRLGEKKLDKPKDKLKELNDLYIRKNQDYGDSFGLSIKKYGDVAYFVRAEDKINRLETLLFGINKRQVKDESVQDTLDDLLNYTIMYLMTFLPTMQNTPNHEAHEHATQVVLNNYTEDSRSLPYLMADLRKLFDEGYQNYEEYPQRFVKITSTILNIMGEL